MYFCMNFWIIQLLSNNCINQLGFSSIKAKFYKIENMNFDVFIKLYDSLQMLLLYGELIYIIEYRVCKAMLVNFS